jgi:bifunctional non-homologous end joining protein LigD
LSTAFLCELLSGQACEQGCCGSRETGDARIHQTATGHLRAKVPVGAQWLHEIKFDGYRVQAHINGGRKKIFTRNGLDWTKRFSVIAGTLDIPGQAIIDGEVVVLHEGRTNFSELQADLAAGKQDRLVYYAFDLLWRDGDLRKLAQIERKQMLSDLLGENDIGAPAVYSEHLARTFKKSAFSI